ncbi:MAG: hypothetical protein ACXWQO_16855 [Bdellovibrionota bacterium]
MTNSSLATDSTSKKNAGTCRTFIRLNILTKIFLFLLVSVSAQAAAPDFLIYQAKHRPAEELMNMARGLFGAKANFSTMNEKIVINADKSTGTAVLKLFAELDHAPRRFSVSTRTVGQGESTASGVGVGRAGVRVQSGNSETRGASGETVQVLEGAKATVGSGYDRVRIALQALGENRVRVRILQTNSEELSTETDIPLGKWQALGGIGHAGENSKKEILSRDSGSQSSKSRTEIRVTLLPESK